jgi:hypothetical protein
MASNIDVRKVVSALADSKAVNLDMSLRDLVASPAVDLVNSVANLEPWELICYTWVTLIRRDAFDARVIQTRVPEMPGH